MNWRGKKVLVTGADGFIGSHLVERLSSEGAEVTALALYNSFDQFGWLDDIAPEARSNVRAIRGNVCDPAQMQALCRGQDVVFHLAALISIPHSYEAAASYIDTNVKGTCNVMQACLDSQVARVVHTSTSEVYGTAQFVPITEDHPYATQSPYAASKLGADMLAISFARSFDLPVTVLRPFNTFGPRQSERAVISTIIRQAMDERTAEIRLGDLTPKRDFTFVADTVAAFLAVAGLDAGHRGATFNAGSGHMVSIGELAEMVRSSVGCNKPIQEDSVRLRPRESEVFALQADASRLQAASGWKPSVKLRDGIMRTVDWWRQRLAAGRVRAGFDYVS